MDIEDLRTAVSGAAVVAGDEDWDAARRFHSGIGVPDVVVRAASVDDVRAAVRWAAASALPVAARGGGHSAWGSVPGGVTIDLSALDDVEIDGTLVRVGGGATWGAVAGALSRHGLGISSGDTASVGVGGLTLGGGIGWMVRAWGLAADQLVGAQVVTARGEILDTSESAHPELFWALRGGGGNFGVVTRFDFRAHELPAVVFATLSVTGDSRPLLAAVRDAMTAAPRALTVTFMDVPPMDPSAPAGASITACWIGDDEDAARAALAPVLAAPGVSEIEFGVRAYPDILLDMPGADPDAPMPGFVGGNILARVLSDELIDRLVSFRERHPASVLFLRSLGGALGDIDEDETAFAFRDASWFAMAGAFDIPGMLDADDRADALAAWAEIEGQGSGVYGNFTTSVEDGWVERMFPDRTLARLVEVKRAWDPGNVFSRTHNVRP